jgi:hypothetical protein
VVLLIIALAGLLFYLAPPRSMTVIISSDTLWVAAGRFGEPVDSGDGSILRAYCSDASGLPKPGVMIVGEVHSTKQILSGGQTAVSDVHGHATLFVTEEIDVLVINGVRLPNHGWNVLVIVVR